MKKEVVRNDHLFDALFRRVSDKVKENYFPEPDEYSKEDLIKETLRATLEVQREMKKEGHR
jgi:hypothetical protein